MPRGRRRTSSASSASRPSPPKKASVWPIRRLTAQPTTSRLEEEMLEVSSREAAAELPIEGELPDLGGATTWLDLEPLTPAGLRGKVVLVQFCTYSCVNWLRTLPYVRAWDERYRDDGLVVIGAHSPEFPFEHDVEKVRAALEAMGVEYPIAID